MARVRADTPERTAPNWPTWLIVNGRSRSGALGYQQWANRLDQVLNLVGSSLVRSHEEFLETLQEARSHGVRRLIVGGGDGTLSSAADELRRHPDAVLGVLPLGTGNTFFAGLGLPYDPERLIRALAQAPIAAVDIGEAVSNGESHIFLNSASIGISSLLVQLLRVGAKQRFGIWAWPLEMTRALQVAPKFTVTLTYPDGRERYGTRQLVVANGHTIAGRLRVTQGPANQDGLLEVFRLGGPSMGALLRTTWHLCRGQLLRTHHARYRVVREVHIATEVPMPVDLDGDLWRSTPVFCRALPNALRVLVGEHVEGAPSPN
jgi:diacylglycerol kinase (ATP)